jgi:dihydroflavonol-4-reductase
VIVFFWFGSDVATAFLTAMDIGSNGQAYLLTAINCTVSEMFGMLQRISGVRPPILRVPSFVFVGGSYVLNFYNSYVRGDWREGLDPVKAEMSNCYWYVDASRAKHELNFQARDPIETLRDTVAYVQQHAPPGTLNPSEQLRARL